jgi:hypothetical protein
MNIIEWKLENDKIILTIALENDEKQLIELPNDIYKEIVAEGPPSEEAQVRELMGEIHRIQKDRIRKVEEIDKQVEDKSKALDTARSGLESSTEMIEVKKYASIISAISTQITAIRERRHLAKFLLQEEGQLQVRLARLHRGR